jgi:hypothetical protein
MTGVISQKIVVLDNHQRDSLQFVLISVSYRRMGICEDISKVKINVEIVKVASVYGQLMLLEFVFRISSMLYRTAGLLGLPLKIVVLCVRG